MSGIDTNEYLAIWLFSGLLLFGGQCESQQCEYFSRFESNLNELHESSWEASIEKWFDWALGDPKWG